MPKKSSRSTAKRTVKQKRTTQASHQLKARREEIVKSDSELKSKLAGQLTIKGLRSAEDRGDVMMIVASAARSAEVRNSAAKVTGLSLSGHSLLIDTNDSKLAESLGKRIHRSRKGGSLTITWGDKDIPVRVIWQAASRKSK